MTLRVGLLPIAIGIEATVVQKPNQGTIPYPGCNRIRGSFFVTFLPAPSKVGVLLRGRSKKVKKEFLYNIQISHS